GSAASNGAQSCGQLVEIEWFADVVVCAGVEARNAFRHLVACREQKHGRAVFGIAEFLQEIEPRSVGKHDVEHDAIVTMHANSCPAVLAVSDGIDRKTLEPKPNSQPVEQQRIVFYNQY